MSKRRKPKFIAPKAKTVAAKSPGSLLDIVIPVYGRFDMLSQCLTALPAACGGLSYNVILVDDASPDKAEADAFYKTLDPKIIVVHNKENAGFISACRQGANRKGSPLIYFLNSDVIHEPESIVHMVMAMDDPEVGIVGAKLLFPVGTPHGPAGMVQHVGLVTNIKGDFDHLFIGWRPDHPRVLQVRDVLAVTGATFMIRRSLWNAAGGFDPIFGRGTYEDIDLSLKVLSMGKRVVIEQKAIGTHYVGATATKYNLPWNLNSNKNLFLARWAGHYPWSAWMYS